MSKEPWEGYPPARPLHGGYPDVKVPLLKSCQGKDICGVYVSVITFDDGMMTFRFNGRGNGIVYDPQHPESMLEVLRQAMICDAFC